MFSGSRVLSRPHAWPIFKVAITQEGQNIQLLCFKFTCSTFYLHSIHRCRVRPGQAHTVGDDLEWGFDFQHRFSQYLITPLQIKSGYILNQDCFSSTENTGAWQKAKKSYNWTQVYRTIHEIGQPKSCSCNDTNISVKRSAVDKKNFFLHGWVFYRQEFRKESSMLTSNNCEMTSEVTWVEFVIIAIFKIKSSKGLSY